MKRLLSVVIFTFAFTSACQTTQDHTGSGPIELQGAAKRGFSEYLDKLHPTIFAVTIDGASNFGYLFCRAGPKCSEQNKIYPRVIELCEKRSQGLPCKVYAVGQKIVWEDAGSRLWDPQKPNLKRRTFVLTKADIKANLFHTERSWLTGKQLQQFGAYLKVLENDGYPIGTFVVADDGQYYWTTHANEAVGPKRSADRALRKCKERSVLPKTCRIFATNNIIVALNTSTTRESYRILIRESTGLVEDVEAVSSSVRIDWANLAPPFDINAKPVFKEGSWVFSFSPPGKSNDCETETQLNLDGSGVWSAKCDGGQYASGTIKLDPRSLSSTSRGTDNNGGKVFVYSTPNT